MKKFVSLLVLAALLLSSFIIPAFAEEPLLGVWYANVDHPTEIPQDVLDAFKPQRKARPAMSISRLRCWAVRSSRA